ATHDASTVIVEDGRIRAVEGPHVSDLPEGTEVIDVTRATLMPGLIDVHVHLAYSGIPHKSAFRAEAANLSYTDLALRAAGYARRTLLAGYTSVRDMHAPGAINIALRDAIDAGHVVGPRVRACGLGLSVTGGHMDQPGWGQHVHLDDMTSPCDGPTGFVRGVREQVKRGADFIKINACVSSMRDPRHPYRQEMSDQELEAACDEAESWERDVGAHTSGGPGLAAAVRAGVRTVEHGHWLDQETVDLMAERGAFYVPTLLVNERNFDFSAEEMGATERSWRWLQLAREAKWPSLALAQVAGVKIATGSDAGFMLPHGTMNAREIALLVQGGLSPVDALSAATATGAELLRLDAGEIAPGRLADLLVVDGDPTRDVGILQDQHRLRVFKGGIEVRPTEGTA
ncbi:MAG: amidohydrolase family protein, partial [Pseudomonadota bacterium]